MPGNRKRARTEEIIHDSSSSEDENFGTFEESDEEIPTEQNYVHPLKIDVILETLFNYVKPYDLKECRLVSKKWNILTLPSARSTFVATIHGDLSRSPIADTRGVNDFVKLFGSNCSGLPFTKFILGSFDPTAGHGKECLQLFGEEAKKIDLYQTGEIHFVENISSILKSVPKLEYFKHPAFLANKSKDASAIKLFSGLESEIPAFKLLKTLEVENDIPHEMKQVCPTLFEELLSAAENISTIFTSHRSPHSTTGLELLKILEILGRQSQIEVLSLTGVDAEHLDVLKKMVGKSPGLKLKHLSISQGISVSPDSWCDDILDVLKESLVSVQVHNSYRFSEHFPRMPGLKLLDLRLRTKDPNLYLINGFKDSFPALQYFRLSSDDEVELDEYFAGTECCPSMESLNLGDLIIVHNQTFERVLDVFPNLKELEMNVAEYVEVDGADMLHRIWTQMTRLEKLKISGRLKSGNNIESIVTGISGGGILKIGVKTLESLKDMTMEVRGETISALLNKYRTRPSIGDLTNLKYPKFNMTAAGGRYGGYDFRLCDLTGYFGFYSMKNLRHLSISDCKLSKSCSEQLVKDMGLDSWKFQGPGERDIIPPIWTSDDDFDWDKFPSSKF